MLSKSKMADAEDDDAFLYGNEPDENKEKIDKKKVDTSAAETNPADEGDAAKENVNPDEKQSTENGAAVEKDDDDAKEAGELSNEDEDEDDDDDDDDDDDVQVTIGEINTSGTGYVTPYATPVNWNFKGGAVASASKGTPAAGSKHLDLNAEGTVNGVGIYEFDMESVDDKPWRKPGADITDYFNYGFTEDTWKQYCEKQRRMRLELTLQKKIFVHHAGAPTAAGQGDIAAGSLTDARIRKAGPPPERRMEGSIDVIGAVGSRVESRRHQDEDMMPPHMMPDGMQKRGFPGNRNIPPGMPPNAGPPMFNVPVSDPSMGPPQHMGGPPISSVSGPPPMGVPPRFPPGGPPGGPGGMPGMMPPGMQQPPPGMNQPPGSFPPDGIPHDAMGFPGRGGLHGRGRGRGFHPGMPGMPPPGEFPPGMDERGPRIPFEDGMPPFYPGEPVPPFPPMMGPPPHGMPWEGGMGRGFMPHFREFPIGLPRPGGESPGRGARSEDDSEYGSSEDDKRRDREHKKRDKDKDRERSREHRERTRERHADRDRSPRRERDRERRDRESRRHRDRDKDREKGSDRDREKREERSSRRERNKEQKEKKRLKGSSEAASTDGQEEGEVVSKRRSRRTRESKQPIEIKQEPAEQEEGQLSSP